MIKELDPLQKILMLEVEKSRKSMPEDLVSMETIINEFCGQFIYNYRRSGNEDDLKLLLQTNYTSYLSKKKISTIVGLKDFLSKTTTYTIPLNLYKQDLVNAVKASLEKSINPVNKEEQKKTKQLTSVFGYIRSFFSQN